MNPAFTEEEKVRIRHHLGYMNVSLASAFALSVPTGLRTDFLLEMSMTKVLPAAYPQARKLLAYLEQLEEQKIMDAELLAFVKVDEIEFASEEQSRVHQLYRQFQAALANLFGVAPNPYDQREGTSGINIGVDNGGGFC